jgi:hypothetical protein
MEQLHTVLEWAKANPWTATAIVVYVIANLAPRPHHGKMTGWQKAFWQIVDRLCVLTSHRVPGGLKFLLLDSPERGSDGEVEKAPKPPADDDDEQNEEDEDEDEDKDDLAVVVDSEDESDEPEQSAEGKKKEGSDSDG